ncbi:DUF441 domain-containing protein [Alicyclobacillus tolerans]|uniref:DUF441 domain-containing protein n=1 Tax=Alicyclobacillus tolerans TaxID=90970 RepID=UPI001F323675|nr:DUF441 family protein [Alicyclobacillus tolerans]MCF8563714.1 DUF441 domain-containing protein [Alicyclobacillus tolerans]
MLTPEMFLILFIVVGVVSRVNIVSVAASLLLILRMLRLERYFPMLERRSLELGLLFLMISILVPLANGKVNGKEAAEAIFSVAGIATILGGIVATVINNRGLILLQTNPSLLLSIVVGTVVGIVLFRGMPVGPLMAAALAAVTIGLIDLIGNLFR